jgi:hypothetical protein
MKLFYRGVSYEYNASQATLEDRNRTVDAAHAPQLNLQLRYRGNTYMVNPHTEAVSTPNTPAVYNLSYRGTTYRVNGAVQADVRGVFPKLALVW